MAETSSDIPISEPNEVTALLAPDLEGVEAVVERLGESLLGEAAAEEADEVRWLRQVRAENSHLGWRKPGVGILCFVLGLITLTHSIILSPTIVLSLNKVCRAKGVDGACDMSSAQAEFSDIQTGIAIICGIVGTLLAGKLGELSDRFGRKPILIYIGMVRLLTCSAIFCTVIPQTPYSKTLMIFANSLESLHGGILVIVATGNSYAADCTEAHNRTLAISMLMSTFYGAMGLGPLIGSSLVKIFKGNSFVPFFLAFGGSIVYLIFVSFVLTESRHGDALKHSQNHFLHRKRSISSIASNGSSSYLNNRGKYHLLQFLDLLSPLKKLWLPPSVHGSFVGRYTVVALVSMDVLFIASTTAAAAPILMYGTFRYHWDSVDLGYFITLLCLGRAFVLLLIAPLSLSWLKKYYPTLKNSIDAVDMISLRVAMGAVVLSFLAAVRGDSKGYSMIIYAMMQNLSALFSPTVQSTVAKYCSQSSVGEVFGAMALIRSLAMLVFPVLILQIYGHTVNKQPRAFLLVPLCSALIALAISFTIKIVTDSELLRRPSQVSIKGSSDRSDVSSSQPVERRASTSKSLRVPPSRN
ncbi:LADA_0E04522g1_1 [Lachancea dasiensis]|uniref:LADA_0E04522g1_1 n=1 Tax=Lachancea dasiensis TaxID=1072105 RepID=A0A1G4JCB7_9SACH|nr:LADA_0E04522g1_1 [Lachancea dasiensis]